MLLARIALIGCALVAVPNTLRTACAGEVAVDAWTLAQDGGGRRCPVTLRFDPAGAAGALGMPAGCRRAFPSLASARTWAMEANGAIRFRDAAGQNLVLFSRESDNSWRGEGGSSLTLLPPSATSAVATASALADATDAGPIALMPTAPESLDSADTTLNQSVIRVAATAPKTAPAAPASDAAGRYAVMRGDRDTGCMITLDGGQKAAKGSLRARLAPACRDQGIIIFDPLSWHMGAGQLVLTARKGHSISLDKDENGVWTKTPKDSKALGLKPL